MATRYWNRFWVGEVATEANYTAITHAFNLQTDHGATTDEDTVLRQMLDLRATLRIPDSQPESFASDWWEHLYIACAVGVGNATDTTPLNLASPGGDPRITGTGFLYNTRGYASMDPGIHVGSWRLQQTLDSHGMRKSALAHDQPIALCTIHVYQTDIVISPSMRWTLDVFGYWRVLWETP